jgi:hypothetical protein
MIIFVIYVVYFYVLRLKINLLKLEFVFAGDVDGIGGLACILGCKVTYLPMKYLDLPLGALYKAKLIWDGIVEMSIGWFEEALFFKAGRLTLIKSTLFQSTYLLFVPFFSSSYVLLTGLRSF